MGRFFLDTEFTHFDSPKIISLGLVGDNGEEFYRELSDTWNLAECSLFVVGQVLPTLDGGRFGQVLSDRLGGKFELIREETKEEGHSCDPSSNPALAASLWVEEDFAAKLAMEEAIGEQRVQDFPVLLSELADIDLATAIRGANAATACQTGADLSCWLEDFQGQIEICYNYETDRALFEQLLHMGAGAASLDISYVYLSLFDLWDGKDQLEVVHGSMDRGEHGKINHHALDDARFFRSFWLQYESLMSRTQGDD
jgi:hypothetical protein